MFSQHRRVEVEEVRQRMEEQLAERKEEVQALNALDRERMLGERHAALERTRKGEETRKEVWVAWLRGKQAKEVVRMCGGRWREYTQTRLDTDARLERLYRKALARMHFIWKAAAFSKWWNRCSITQNSLRKECVVMLRVARTRRLTLLHAIAAWTCVAVRDVAELRQLYTCIYIYVYIVTLQIFVTLPILRRC